jgi:hypothetical protein
MQVESIEMAEIRARSVKGKTDPTVNSVNSFNIPTMGSGK